MFPYYGLSAKNIGNFKNNHGFQKLKILFIMFLTIIQISKDEKGNFWVLQSDALIFMDQKTVVIWSMWPAGQWWKIYLES